MSGARRAVWACVLLAALAAFGLFVLGGEPAAKAGSGRWQTSRQCKACHEEVFREWHGSHHQIAYLNPEVRKLSDDFRNKACQACHLPRPISITGYGSRTLPRFTRRDEGVGCLTCHLGAEGQILGRHDRPGVPCKPRASAELVSVELCASCHNQHQTTDQWRASHYAREGIDCRSCHMPEVPRQALGGKPGRGHVFAGAHDRAMLRRAGRLAVRVDGDQLVLNFQNVGAGHNLPTEERHRAVDLMVRFFGGGRPVGEWLRAYRFRQPYRDEEGENTQLPVDGIKTLRVPIPPGRTSARVRVWYRLTPYVTDEDPLSTLLEERQVKLR